MGCPDEMAVRSHLRGLFIRSTEGASTRPMSSTAPSASGSRDPLEQPRSARASRRSHELSARGVTRGLDSAPNGACGQRRSTRERLPVDQRVSVSAPPTLFDTEGVRWRPRQRGGEKSGQARHEPYDPTVSGSRDSSPRWRPRRHVRCRPCARVHPPSIISEPGAPMCKHCRPADDSVLGVDALRRSTTVAGVGAARQCVRGAHRWLPQGRLGRLVGDPDRPGRATDRVPSSCGETPLRGVEGAPRRPVGKDSVAEVDHPTSQPPPKGMMGQLRMERAGDGLVCRVGAWWAKCTASSAEILAEHESPAETLGSSRGTRMYRTGHNGQYPLSSHPSLN